MKAKKTITLPKKRSAYVAVIDDDGTHRLGIATEGEEGYHKIRADSDAGGEFKTHSDAQASADRYNERLGLSKAEASKIVISTMRFKP